MILHTMIQRHNPLRILFLRRLSLVALLLLLVTDGFTSPTLSSKRIASLHFVERAIPSLNDQQARQKSSPTGLFSSSSLPANTDPKPVHHDTNHDNDDHDNETSSHPWRTRLRRLTGVSLTASRATMRALTGLSLTTIYASVLAISGAWVRQTMKLILSIFPTWLRYFLQPFLVLYYAPLFILRNWTGPTRREARTAHEHFVEGWKHAVELADDKTSYWPIHVNAQGDFEKDFAEIDLNEGIEESVEVALEEGDDANFQ